MSKLGIGGATLGYEQGGLTSLANEVQSLGTDVATSIRNSTQNVLNAINSVWVGASAESFKTKLEDDTDVMAKTMIDLGIMTKNEILKSGAAVEDYDNQIAAALFGASYAGGVASGGALGLSIGLSNKRETKTETKSVLADLKSTWDKVNEVCDRTAATIEAAEFGFVEGVAKFGEAIFDFATILGTGVGSIGTGVYDLGNYIYCKATGNEYESMTVQLWKDTQAYVAKDFVGSAFDSFYDNTTLGQNIKENAYGFETTRAISSGIGYTTGVVALTIATGGAGGFAVSSASLAGTATVAGIGKGTEAAWADGAGIVEGLGYGVASGAWEGAQFYLGGEIASLSPFASNAANAATRVALDSLDGAAEGFVQPGLQTIYKDESYSQLFDEAGGWKNVGTQAAIGGIASSVGEATGLAKNLMKDGSVTEAATGATAAAGVTALEATENAGKSIEVKVTDLTDAKPTNINEKVNITETATKTVNADTIDARTVDASVSPARTVADENSTISLFSDVKNKLFGDNNSTVDVSSSTPKIQTPSIPQTPVSERVFTGGEYSAQNPIPDHIQKLFDDSYTGTPAINQTAANMMVEKGNIESAVILGDGESSTVYAIGDTTYKAGRMSNFGGTSMSEYVKDSQHILQPTKEVIIDQYSRVIEAPKLDTSNITQKDVTDLWFKLKDDGYIWSDLKTENVGRDAQGNLKLLDYGQLLNLNQTPSSWDNREIIYQINAQRNLLSPDADRGIYKEIDKVIKQYEKK